MRQRQWTRAVLGNHCEIVSGYPFKSAQFSDDADDIALVKGENVGQGRVLWEIAKKWPRADFEELRRYELVGGDVVLAMDRPWVPAGLKFARLPENSPNALLVQRVARLRARDGFDQSFLANLIGSPNFTAYIRNIARGVGVPHVSSKETGAFEFLLPPLGAQREIASILSTYDNLIENNRRRIQLLEQAARLLYREWFVRLRFPGHEHVAVREGVPEGWTRATIGEIADTVGGGTPSTKVPDYWDGDIDWVVPTDVTRNEGLILLDTARKISERGLRESSAKIVPARTILMTSRASVGYFALMDRPACTNQGFINVIPHDDVTRLYVLFNLMARVEEIRANAKGTTYPEISKGRFREMAIVVPSRVLLVEFTEQVSKLVAQLGVLKKMTRRLVEARDLLLPRLMSGELTV